MRRWLGLALLFFAVAHSVDAAPPPTPAAKTALAVTDAFVVPRYRALATAAQVNLRAWDVFCNGRARGQEQSLRAAYNALADRWAQIGFVKTGPMSLFLRTERFDYWPEARNATQTSLTALLTINDPRAFDPKRLVYDNIPAQGLPALERLLYEPSFAQHANRCRVGVGLARNLAAIASDVVNAWTGAGGVRAAIAADKGWNNSIFANATEAASMLATDMVGAITAMNDQKLLVPMGASPAMAKPHAAEEWRSGRSKRDLVLNIDALGEMERTFASGMGAADRAKLDAMFASAEVAVKALPDDLPGAVADPKGRARFTAARAALKAAQTAVVAIFPKALNISLGFNSLDGD